jgi:NAD(P)-dependent dehydrogenase (short-subunit alcohol dehydrogenase family)
VGEFDGKVALVTGAGRGIGGASATAFGREGAAVAVADIDEEAGAKTVKAIIDAGGTAKFFRCDVSYPHDVEQLVAAVVERFGGLDVAHNNAGIEGEHVSVEEIPVDDWQRVIDINLTGVWLCMRSEIPAMRNRGGGAIINTSSASGLIGGPALGAYTASKHGVIGLTKAAAVDLGTSGIRINAICPGATDTLFVADIPPEVHEFLMNSTPLRRYARPEEIAEAVVWLASERASYVHGAAVPVDGGVVAG